MQINTEKNHQSSKYSFSIDLFVYWARNTYLSKNLETGIDLNNEIDACLKDTSINDDLGQGINRLINTVHNALQCLCSEATLYLNEDDISYARFLPEEVDLEVATSGEPGIDVLLAFQKLDDAILLFLAFEEYPLPGTYQELRLRVNELVTSITTDQQPPSHRLIPLNILRRKRLAAIPENMRFYFPWYEQFCDLPSFSLAFMAEAMAGRLLSADEIQQVHPDTMQLLYDAICADDIMYKRLKKEAIIWKELPHAFADAWAWRLLQTATRYAANLTMPDKVVETGMIGCAIRLVCQAASAGIPKDEWCLRAAFCGIGLSNKERIELLEPVEREMLAGTFEGSGKVGKEVQQWFMGKCDDTAMAHKSFQEWIVDLQNTADKGFVQLPFSLEQKTYQLLLHSENPLPLITAITFMDKIVFAPEQATAWLSRMIGSIAEMVQPSAIPFPVSSHLDEEKEAATKDISLADILPVGPLPLPEIASGFGLSRVPLLEEDEFTALRERIEGLDFYWSAEIYLDLAEPTIIRREIKPANLPIALTLEDIGGDYSNCQVIMVAISNDQQTLINAIGSPPIHPPGEQTSIAVFWITYVKTS